MFVIVDTENGFLRTHEFSILPDDAVAACAADGLPWCGGWFAVAPGSGVMFGP
ncbi:MAG: hypothetical protein NVSMB62_21710 [Acidobacteriaceae bacterium]